MRNSTQAHIPGPAVVMPTPKPRGRAQYPRREHTEGNAPHKRDHPVEQIGGGSGVSVIKREADARCDEVQTRHPSAHIEVPAPNIPASDEFPPPPPQGRPRRSDQAVQPSPERQPCHGPGRAQPDGTNAEGRDDIPATATSRLPSRRSIAMATTPHPARPVSDRPARHPHASPPHRDPNRRSCPGCNP